MNPTATNPAEIQQSSQANSKKKVLIIFSIILSIALIICIVIIFLSNSKPLSDTNNQLPSSYSTPQIKSYPISYLADEIIEEEQLETFDGKFLTGELPVGWSIKEYTDVSGMHEYVESNIVTNGLSGFEIFDEFNVSVYRVGGLNGVGGTSGCSELAVFDDTDQSYVETMKEENKFFIPELELNIIDLTKSNYTEINFLGLRMRRIDNSIYLSMKNDTNAFNTACGINAQHYVFDNLSYTIKDTGSEFDSNIYSAKLNTDINMMEETLVKLDGILNSLEVK
jgi:hypothetical protein